MLQLFYGYWSYYPNNKTQKVVPAFWSGVISGVFSHVSFLTKICHLIKEENNPINQKQDNKTFRNKVLGYTQTS